MWEGHYFFNWVSGELAPRDEKSEWAFGISAEIAHEDNRILGKMTDLKTIIQRDVELIPRNRDWRCPDPEGPLPTATYRIEVPPSSTIEGSVTDGKFEFTKRYDGPCVIMLISNGRKDVISSTSDDIRYFGELREDSTLMIGGFQILGSKGSCQGRFQLRRAQLQV